MPLYEVRNEVKETVRNKKDQKLMTTFEFVSTVVVFAGSAHLAGNLAFSLMSSVVGWQILRIIRVKLYQPDHDHFD